MVKFNCQQCGVCCTKLNLNELYSDLDRGDGTCIYFNEKNKKCSIYENRPIKCNIDKMYELYFKTQYSKEDFYSLNKKACEILKK